MSSINLFVNFPQGTSREHQNAFSRRIEQRIEEHIIGRISDNNTLQALRTMLSSEFGLLDIEISEDRSSLRINVSARSPGLAHLEIRGYPEGSLYRDSIRNIEPSMVASPADTSPYQRGERIESIIERLVQRIDELEASLEETDRNVASLELGL